MKMDIKLRSKNTDKQITKWNPDINFSVGRHRVILYINLLENPIHYYYITKKKIDMQTNTPNQ